MNSLPIVPHKAVEKITKYEVVFEELPSENRTMIAEAVGKPYSVAGFQFRLSREFGSIFTNDYLPCMMLLLISFIGFFIPVQMVPGRMALLVTIFLMLVNIGNSERSNMPDAETMTAMDVWILSCMAFLAAALLEYSTLIWLTFSPPAFLEREAF